MNIEAAFEVATHIREWPRWARRMFVLLFPISVPLWIAFWFIIAVAAFIVAPLIHALGRLWSEP